MNEQIKVSECVRHSGALLLRILYDAAVGDASFLGGNAIEDLVSPYS